MRNTLQRLESLLAEKRPTFFASFFPGASEVEIARFEDSLGFSVSASFKELYRWRNGQPRDFASCFQNHMDFMPLSRSIEIHRELSSLLVDGAVDGMVNWWHEKWIPILEGPGGDYLCLDMAGVFEGRVGQLIDYVHNDVCRAIVAPNIETWLESYCRLLAEDAVDDAGMVKGELEYVWVRGVDGYPILHECTTSA